MPSPGLHALTCTYYTHTHHPVFLVKLCDLDQALSSLSLKGWGVGTNHPVKVFQASEVQGLAHFLEGRVVRPGR